MISPWHPGHSLSRWPWPALPLSALAGFLAKVFTTSHVCPLEGVAVTSRKVSKHHSFSAARPGRGRVGRVRLPLAAPAPSRAWVASCTLLRSCSASRWYCCRTCSTSWSREATSSFRAPFRAVSSRSRSRSCSSTRCFPSKTSSRSSRVSNRSWGNEDGRYGHDYNRIRLSIHSGSRSKLLSKHFIPVRLSPRCALASEMPT